VSDDARRLAINAVVRIEQEGAYANVVVPAMLGESDLDERDRGFVTELVYGSTRMRRRLDHVVDRFLVQPPPPTARAALRIGAHQLLHLATPPHAAVSATVAASPKRFRGFINAVLRKVAGSLDHELGFPSLGVELSYPDWIVERFTADLGADAARQALTVMNTPALVHRRDDGYVQDPSSQAVASEVPVNPGDRVLDVCAAPGGKATALAQRGARVIAGDRRRARAGLIVENRHTLELDDLHVVQADATCPPFAPASFDAVLVDAPCSGLGALRRRPDARWRVAPGDVDELAALQSQILRATAELVRPGGWLVYSVCTLTMTESSGVVDDVAAALHEQGFAPVAPEGQHWQPYGSASVLLPGSDSDGMALARWIKH
jgi:16S rRNA (cytosine967-C5)-methyltransferase